MMKPNEGEEVYDLVAACEDAAGLARDAAIDGDADEDIEAALSALASDLRVALAAVNVYLGVSDD